MKVGRDSSWDWVLVLEPAAGPGALGWDLVLASPPGPGVEVWGLFLEPSSGCWCPPPGWDLLAGGRGPGCRS